MNRNLLVAAVLTSVFSASALAQNPPAKSAAAPTGVKACKKDIRRFCKNVKPGEGRLGACLHSHLAELSKSCRTYAGHGGAGHELTSLQDLDLSLAPTPAPKK